MDGNDRAAAWISGFSAVAFIGLVTSIAMCNVRNHAADNARIVACEAAVAAVKCDVSACTAKHDNKNERYQPRCSGDQQSYMCCVEREQASTLHCWR
jgi:hypothetical protein